MKRSSDSAAVLGAGKKKRESSFAAPKVQDIDYKNVDLLRRFVTEKGKVLPRRITGVSSQYQKKIKKAIKRARYIALLPFVTSE